MKNPFPNIAVGMLIGSANDSWWAIAIVCVGWAFIFCAYLWMRNAHEPLLADMRGGALPNFWFGSATASLWVLTWIVTFVVSLLFASASFAVRQLV